MVLGHRETQHIPKKSSGAFLGFHRRVCLPPPSTLSSAETLVVASDFIPNVFILPCPSSHNPPHGHCVQGVYKVRNRDPESRSV